jgi:thioredoxin-related protein
MNKLSTVIVGLSTVLPLAAQDQTPPAAAEASSVWFADFDKAAEAATAQKKDLLVDFTGSDWCGWCIKLHEEVFAHESFVSGAQKNFVLVALDFPRSEEAKAKVPNPERNQELAKKYGVQGFPTVLLMTPAGDVFGRTGYAPGGPEKYLESIDGMLTTGKTRMAEIAGLQKSFAAAKPGKERDALVATALTMLAGMSSDDVGIEKIAAIAKEATTSTDGATVERAVTALLKSGQADDAVRSKAEELDPKNEKGLWERSLQAKMSTVQDDAGAKAFLAELDKLMELGGKDKEVVGTMLYTAMRWAHGPLQDKEAAKKWAQALQKHVEGTPEAERYAKTIEMVLNS